ncbi:AraC family transcriptional regulator [Solitalea longa]|uniref:AraC family transcriptional regulator n=1 Tax=Solitalea longa TaxID=2079460 RepID=A0A2S4ZYC2_9SPHI|nr:helix-turn-helix domain-containing protein [Solitalea longa]POY35358.1 AraC family transcriptional regulator [Solitalea longa]
MLLRIKNMVCNRCIKVVKDELEKIGQTVNSIKLGEVELDDTPNEHELERIKSLLEDNGFELLEDKQSKLIELIKNMIIELVHRKEPVNLQINLSDYLSSTLNVDYSYLSNLFSSFEGITIEKYLILQRIEKAKELIFYDELTLSEIAYQLGYSSVAHLSSQFKKTTGLTPSEFKKLRDSNRKALDKVGGQQ